MTSRPMYNPIKPLQEKIEIVGKTGSGKNVLCAYLLSRDPNPYTFFDSIGAMARMGFKPTRPHIQKIVTPPDALSFFFVDKKQNAPLVDLFNKTCEQVVAQGNQTFWVDEAEEYTDKWWYQSRMKAISNKGRNINLNLGIIHQRPAQIHNDVLGNVDHRFIFALELDGDRDFYAKIIPNGKIIMEQHKLLKQYAFLYYNAITKQTQFCDPL